MGSKLHKRIQKRIERDRSLLETYIENWTNAVHKKLLTQIKMKGENMQDCPKNTAKNNVLSDLASSFTAPIQNTQSLDIWTKADVLDICIYLFSLVQLVAVILFMLKPLKQFCHRI